VKLSDVLLFTLFIVMGTMIFAIKKMQLADKPEQSKVPVPTLKSEPSLLPEASLETLLLEMSTPKKAGSYGRLSLDDFLVKDTVDIIRHDQTPKAAAHSEPPANNVIKRPVQKDERALLNTMPEIKLSDLHIETAQPVNLPYRAAIDKNRFVDRILDMTEASPIQPDSRGCGALNHNLKSAPKHSKVRSVGMERKITNRASIGVEYVYKDGCYKKAIAPLDSLDMPGDDGVNLRVNMKF